jgi:hypothetical protein
MVACGTERLDFILEVYQIKTPQVEEFKHNRYWRATIDAIATEISSDVGKVFLVNLVL